MQPVSGYIGATGTWKLSFYASIPVILFIYLIIFVHFYSVLNVGSRIFSRLLWSDSFSPTYIATFCLFLA